MRRVLVLMLALMLFAQSALASPLPDLFAFDGADLEIVLSAQVTSHMPLDETRTAELSRLLSHVQLRLRTERIGAESWQQVGILVDGAEAAVLTERSEDGLSVCRASFMPQTAVGSMNGSAMMLLLGEDDAGLDLTALDVPEIALADDAWTLLGAWYEARKSDFSVKKSGKTIKGFGKTAYVCSFSTQKNVDTLAAELAALCPEGELKRLLSRVTFSGKQSVTILTTQTGEIRRLTYTGRAALDGEGAHTVTLQWSMDHDDPHSPHDSLSFKSTAAKGSDYSAFSFERAWEGTRLTLKSQLTVREDKAKRSRSVKLALDIEEAEGSWHIAGEATIDSSSTGQPSVSLTLSPDLAVNPSALTLSGQLGVSRAEDKANIEAATLTLTVSPLESFAWEMPEQVTLLETLGDTELEALNAAFSGGLNLSVLSPLVLLPREDTLYLFRDLSDEAVNRIVDAAKRGVQE